MLQMTSTLGTSASCSWQEDAPFLNFKYWSYKLIPVFNYIFNLCRDVLSNVTSCFLLFLVLTKNYACYNCWNIICLCLNCLYLTLLGISSFITVSMSAFMSVRLFVMSVCLSFGLLYFCPSLYFCLSEEAFCVTFLLDHDAGFAQIAGLVYLNFLDCSL